MAILKRTLPAALAIAVGLFVLAAIFAASPLLDALGTYFVDMAVIIAAFALFLGMVNILRVHARKIRQGDFAQSGQNDLVSMDATTVLFRIARARPSHRKTQDAGQNSEEGYYPERDTMGAWR